ncbi:MAG TPA: LiaF-related protein [Bacteroidales bacterium]|nr:LiaF-related protein [Bacteroidales bacterium]HRW95044.1 LiaF-related protein [Bacteroidales bacterium]
MEILDDRQEQGVQRQPERHKHASGGIIIGLVMIVAGIILIFSNAGWIPYALRRILLSWQMLLIVLGIVSFARKQNIQGAILLVIGIVFLLPRIGALNILPGFEWFTHLNWGNLWPLILVGIGVLIFTKSRRSEIPPTHNRQYPRNDFSGKSSSNSGGYVNYSMVFSGSEHVFMESVFRGGSIETVFGGMTLDLRRTNLQEGISYLKISSVFGGTTLLIPTDWNVEIRTDAVLGGFKDNRPMINNSDNSSRLIIDAECVFGGGEIK